VAKNTVLTDVEKRLATVQPYKKKIWFDNCPAQVQAELLEVKQRFKDGKYASSRMQLAKIVMEVVRPHMVVTPSFDSVDRWLAR
jgi:hypothetical protein